MEEWKDKQVCPSRNGRTDRENRGRGKRNTALQTGPERRRATANNSRECDRMQFPLQVAICNKEKVSREEGLNELYFQMGCH